MEQFFSPSDAWDQLAKELDWDRKEGLIESIFPDHASMAEGGALNVCSQLLWIEYAWEHRDSTVIEKYPNKYLEQALKPLALQYHRSIHSEKDYLGWEGSSDKLDVEQSTRSEPKLVTQF